MPSYYNITGYDAGHGRGNKTLFSQSTPRIYPHMHMYLSDIKLDIVSNRHY